MSLPTLFLPPQACTQVAAGLPVWQVDGDICSQRPFAGALPEAARAWRLVLPVEAVTVCRPPRRAGCRRLCRSPWRSCWPRTSSSTT